MHTWYSSMLWNKWGTGNAPTASKAHYPPGTTMLATSKSVLFPSHNHLLTTGFNDTTLIIAHVPASEVSSVPSSSGYELEIGHF